MARKQKHEEHENHDRWLISYADFITLLFAFFVVMYSVSSINEGKYRVLSDALVASFRSSARSVEPIQVGELSKSIKQPGLIKAIIDQNISIPNSISNNSRNDATDINTDDSNTDQREQPSLSAGSESATTRKQSVAINKMADKLEKSMAKLIQQDLIAVRRNDMWVEVEIKTSILFPSGSASLQQEALPILKQIAKILKDFHKPIRVEGFTDSVPINTVAFPSNWELSAGRAASVVHLFTREGVDPGRMAAIGFGEYAPIAENSTPEGRNKNRRVVILILESVSADGMLGGNNESSARKAMNKDAIVDQPGAVSSGKVAQLSKVGELK